MARTIKLTEIVNRSSPGTNPAIVTETIHRPVAIPLSRIDRAEEGSAMSYTTNIAREVPATKIVKVNGDYFYVTEALDLVIEMMNGEDR